MVWKPQIGKKKVVFVEVVGCCTSEPTAQGEKRKELDWSLWWPQNRAFKSRGIGGWKAVLLLVKSTAIDGQKQCFSRGKTSAFHNAFESNKKSIWIKLKLHLNQIHYRVWIKLSLHLNQIESQFESNWEAIRLGLADGRSEILLQSKRNWQAIDGLGPIDNRLAPQIDKRTIDYPMMNDELSALGRLSHVSHLSYVSHLFRPNSQPPTINMLHKGVTNVCGQKSEKLQVIVWDRGIVVHLRPRQSVKQPVDLVVSCARGASEKRIQWNAKGVRKRTNGRAS